MSGAVFDDLRGVWKYNATLSRDKLQTPKLFATQTICGLFTHPFSR